MQTHCIIRDGWCVATNGVLTMGAKVEEQVSLCPQTKRMIAALRRCEDGVSFTQLDSGRVSVKSGGMRVVVPCADLPLDGIVWADPVVCSLGALFLQACAAIAHIATDGGPVVHYASLLGRGQTLTATNGKCLIEYWHGFDLPPYWVLPKVSVNALLKVTKNLTGFGFGGNSATFHFEDESWLKTQLFEDKWPDIDKLFVNGQTNTAIPEGLFEAISIMNEFSETDGFIELLDDKIQIDKPEHAEYAVKGLKGDAYASIKELQNLQKIAKTLDYPEEGERNFRFTGDRLRGILAKAVKR